MAAEPRADTRRESEIETAVGWMGKPVNSILHAVECGLLGRRETPLRHPPVFILGAPRCGSTLLYQLMLDYFDLGYISNLHCKLYGAPSLAELLFRPSRRRGPSSFKSEHGQVKGWSSPSECGDYWYRFFRRTPQYVTLSDITPGSVLNLRRSMRAMGVAMGKPLLFKNLPCSLRLGPIMKALPESAFVVVQRDRLETGQSILEARKSLFGNYGGWFSVEPPEIESLRGRPAHEQVAAQIQSVYRLISEARDRAPERFLDVDYGDICRDTHAALVMVAGFLKGHGIKMARRGDVPKSFETRRRAPGENKIFSDLKEYFDRMPAG